LQMVSRRWLAEPVNGWRYRDRGSRSGLPWPDG
jgi:hypothetical protein